MKNHVFLIGGTMLSSCPLALPALAQVPAGIAGGQVTGGSANIVAGDKRVDVHQNSNRAVIDWRTLDVARGETLQFHQPSVNAVVLNRVNDVKASEIRGSLKANGNVMILNPNGVLFGKNAQVDVGGLLATTSRIDNDSFIAGQYDFTPGGKADAAIINKGRITARQAGLVGLVAPQVENHGIISARLGKVQLASADRFGVDLYGDGLLHIAASDALVKQSITHTGQIDASGGQIALSAAAGKSLVDSLITVSGELKTVSVSEQGGVISLRAAEINIADGSRLNASGATGGGAITVGGDYRGQGDGIIADKVSLAADASLKANALKQGDGGNVILYANEQTNIAGKVFVRVGAQGGNGGLVETSAKKVNIAETFRADARAPQGVTGEWLIDPTDFTIATAGGDITPAAVATALDTANVTYETASAGGDAGDIFVEDALNWTSANTLTLRADRNIEVNAAISNAAGGSLILRADRNGAGSAEADGTVIFGAGGSVNLAGGGRTDIYYNPDDYAVPTDYSGDVTGDYTAWMLVNDAMRLQAMADNLAGAYALGRDIDASATTGWNAGAGFAPVGTSATRFTGQFDGLEHTIDGLFISRSGTTYVGLFGSINNSVIQNVSLTNVSITGNFATGAAAGHMLGVNSRVEFIQASGTISSTNDYIGGIIGWLQQGQASDLGSSVNVTGDEDVGGLVGSINSTATLSDSYMTGNIQGRSYVGGLVGSNVGTITGSWATGNVSASSSRAGGIVGTNFSAGTITDSYATGDVSTPLRGGGFAGTNVGIIRRAYATGQVTCTTECAGFVGAMGSAGGTVQDSYWDVQNSGYAIGVFDVSGYDPALVTPTGLNTADFTDMASFVGFDIDDVGGSGKVWRIYDGQTTPLLRHFMTHLTATANDTSQLNTAPAYTGGNGVIYSGFKTGESAADLLGALAYTGTAQGASAIGSYSITASGFYSGQLGYDIEFIDGTLTISAAPPAPRPPVITPVLPDQPVTANPLPPVEPIVPILMDMPSTVRQVSQITEISIENAQLNQEPISNPTFYGHKPLADDLEGLQGLLDIHPALVRLFGLNGREYY